MFDAFIHFLIGAIISLAIFLTFAWMEGVRRFSAPFAVLFVGFMCGIASHFISPWATLVILTLYLAASAKEHFEWMALIKFKSSQNENNGCAVARKSCQMSKRVVFVDVDDTLVRSAGSKRIPIPAVVARVRELHAEGVELYLWSSGGAEYCRRTANELGIEACFVGFLPKPHAYIDDQELPQWTYCRYVHPNHAEEA